MIEHSQKKLRVELAPWVRGIMCDPLSKTPLKIGLTECESDYGRRYPVVNGVLDLRVLNSHVGVIGKAWKDGQDAYEAWSQRAAETLEEGYLAQRNGMADVYDAIPVKGRCLDVGGSDGRLRAFLADDQEYVSIDAYLDIVTEPRSQAWAHVYPFLDKPLNFVAALAENVPFLSESFDVVHMRSVIDHFWNPELAIREAFRVLRPSGYLIVGLLVKGGKAGNDLRASAKEIVRTALVGAGFTRFRDHHIWHPTYHELCELLTDAGFSLELTHWQRSEGNRVCYIKANKAGHK